MRRSLVKRLTVQVAISAACFVIGGAAAFGFLATFEPAPAGSETAFLLWRIGYACLALFTFGIVVLTWSLPHIRLMRRLW